VRSESWGMTCSWEVNSFRRTLYPYEAELFNECLVRIYREPRIDGIRKFMFRSRDPIVDYLYRDNNFILIYYWVQLKDSFAAYRVKVSHAGWTRDFEEDFTLPKR
jgi:hypothetical protein